MARIHDGLGGQGGNSQNTEIFRAGGQEKIDLPDASFIADAQILRDGQDLVLQDSSSGQTVIIEGYFNADPAPVLSAPDGGRLTPELVDSFVQHAGPLQYAAAETAHDASPIGAVREVSGNATVTHPDGTSETITAGMPVFQGDIIETDAQGSVNIQFTDESTFAVAANAKLALDEYVYDPGTSSGASDFSLLRGMFVYTSGLIGREDPDDVHINTPVGSIGIRGTTVIGAINPDGESYITVTEGAIVVKNGAGEQTLSLQNETLKLAGFDNPIQNEGQRSNSQLASEYNVLRTADPAFFSTMDAAPGDNGDAETEDPAAPAPDQLDAAPTDESGDTEQPQATDPAQTEEGATAEPLPEMQTLEPVPEQNFTGETNTFLDPALNTDGSFLAPPPPGGTTTVFFMPPPPPPGGTTATNTTTAPPPLLPLILDFAGGDLDESAPAGFVLGEVFTTVDFPGVMFSLLNVQTDAGSNPLVDMVQIAPNRVKIVLNSFGAAEVAANGIGFDIIFDVRATLPDGRSVTGMFGGVVFPDPVADIELTALPAGDGFAIGGTTNERLGDMVASWGDADGDGFDDFLVTNSGGIFGVYEASGGLGSFTPTANAADVSGIGDFDGDGTIDYIVGDPGAASNAGDAFIPGILALSFTGMTANQKFGSSVAGIGDINGDGLSDVLIGAPGTAGNKGAAYVVFGDQTPGPSPIDITSTAAMAGSGFTIDGFATNDMLGSEVSSAGDFNKDGYADFVISEPGQNRLHIAFGGAGITGVTLSSGTMTIDSILTGPDSKIPVMSVGDVNGDGVSDIMFGADGANGGKGAAYIVYGSATKSAATDITVAGITGSVGFRIDITDAGSKLEGGGAVGDFNGDGIGDISVVIRTGDMADFYVIYGVPGARGNLTQTLLDDPNVAFHMTYDLTAAGLANPATDPFRFEISSVGDIDGDGFADMAVGTPDANGGDGEVIVVYGRPDTNDLFNGTIHVAGITTPLITDNDVIANGINQSLVGDIDNNNLNQNGFAGISFSGGAGDDTLVVSNPALGNIDGGTGFDVLNFTGAGGVLDFTNATALGGSERLSGIEKFIMMDDNQYIKLGLDDIFRLLQESDDGTLRIKENGGGSLITNLIIDDNGGNAGTLSTQAPSMGFVAAGTDSTSDPGTTYNVYNFGGGYQLLIDQNINNVNVV
ncbi:MAG: FG-GAP repeat protein [Proteobacteria bacterium]|nr:FG-GAP repeat protein [Pseudomonadota bacterium]